MTEQKRGPGRPRSNTIKVVLYLERRPAVLRIIAQKDRNARIAEAIEKAEARHD